MVKFVEKEFKSLMFTIKHMSEYSDDKKLMEKIANENLNIFERLIARLDQIRFYIKARYFPNSREREEYENKKATFELLFPDRPWGRLRDMPHKFAVKKNSGVLGKYIERTTGHRLTPEEIDEAIYGDENDDIFGQDIE